MSERPVCKKCGNWWLQLKRELTEADSFPAVYLFCLLCGHREWRYQPERRALTYRIRSPALKGYGNF
ncbi:MAG: hypothetical protein H7X83_00915 [Verrucomicrobia bacterium]|nr:hypothetical protein [Deltaproteobacteria bacterium]